MSIRFTNPFSRFFNDNSALLASGRLNFFEPDGSSTRKKTFKEFTLDTANANPVILSKGGVVPDIFLDGVYRVTLESKNIDGTFTQIDEAVNFGETADFTFADWNVSVSYGVGGNNIVTGSDGRYYVSIDSPNLANDPTSSPTKWEEIRFLGVFNTNVTYVVGDIVQDTTGFLWRSIDAANLGNTPSASSTKWQPAFTRIVVKGITAGSTQTQAGATALTADINEVTVSGTDLDGVKLPSAAAGSTITIINADSAQSIQVWPATGDDIDGGATDAVDPTPLAAGGSRDYAAVDATSWFSLGAAPAGAAGTILLQTVTATAAADITLDAFSSTHDNYFVLMNDFLTDSGNPQLQCQLKIAGSFRSAAGYQTKVDISPLGSSTVTTIGAANQTQANLSNTASLTTNSVNGLSGRIDFYDANSTSTQGFHSSIPFDPSGISKLEADAFYNLTTGALSGVKLFASANNITGVAELYAYVKA